MGKIDAKKALIWLIAVNIAFSCLYLLIVHILESESYTLTRWFDLDKEGTIPAWFSGAQLLLIAMLSHLYSNSIHTNRSLKTFYRITTAVFIFLSADEAAGIHEGIGAFFRKITDFSFFPGHQGYWIILYPIILLIVFLLYKNALIAFLEEETGRKAMITGAGLFIAGGVFIEAAGYFMHITSYTGVETLTTANIIEITLEESFEMLGESVMIYAMLIKLRDAQGTPV